MAEQRVSPAVIPEQCRVIRSRSNFDAFWTTLNSPDRPPLVVVTIAESATAPEFNLDELSRELDEVAHLYLLPAESTFWLTDALGDRRLSVHSGWARLYPSDRAWQDDPGLAPSFRPQGSRGQVQKRLVEAALSAAFRAGSLRAPPLSAAGEPATAVVRDLLSTTQALVDVRGSQAIMRTQRLAPGLPAERLVSKGQTFQGKLVRGGVLGEFTPDPVALDQVARAVAFVGDGITTSVLVAGVSAARAKLRLHPDVEITVSGRPGEDLTTMIRKGDVVTVEVILFEGEFLAEFSGDEPTAALSVLPGGPPWLEPSAGETAQETEGRPSGDGGRNVEFPGASPELGAAEEEMERLEQRLARSEETIRYLQRQLRVSRRLAIPTVYSDPVRQFRLEVDLDYLCRVSEPERARFAMPLSYRIGSDFLSSVDRLVRDGGITRDKVVEVVCDVLCGRARTMTSRAVKEWLSSPNGSQLMRPDGAKAWRVRLQTGSRAARRLRYWQLQTGDIELDQVGVHDFGLGTK